MTDFATVPAELRERQQWVVWSTEVRDGKPTKVPYRCDLIGRASTDDPATWGTFEDAVAVLTRGAADGIGYVFAIDDPYAGVDLDDCLNGKDLHPDAAAIVLELDSFCEVSPSGEGVKLIVRATKNGYSRCRTRATWNGDFEAYDHERFWAITGVPLAGTPSTIEDRQAQLEAVLARLLPDPPKVGNGVAHLPKLVLLDDRDLIDLAMSARNGSDFTALWQGTWENRYPSHSEADAALCSMLAFWTGRDGDRIDRMFRSSGLYRDKWERADYRASTIGGAIARCADIYSPRRQRANSEALESSILDRDQGLGIAATTATAERPAVPAVNSNLTDLGNAERLIVRHGVDLRYCHPWASWLVWTGAMWKNDDTGEATLRAKETLRALLAEANGIADEDKRKKLAGHALKSEQASRIRGALELARSEPAIPVLPEQLDVHPLILNVNNGAVDLTTGELHPHDRAHLSTKLAPVDYQPDATAPTWGAFLERVLPDAELRAFLRRFIGYSLTGLTTEQVLAILYGPGANGKSVFVETIRAMLGDYGMQAPAETFLERRDTIPNDVARLRGARFVAATETAEGRRLNESLVKRMTGGDTMVARFMRGEWFEFPATFKVVLATNHRPEIRGTDEAIWRRIRLVPFTVTIPTEERDPTLAAQLREELPGILAWAITGCLEWQQHGLSTAAAVDNATADYRQEMDTLGEFIEDTCVTHPDATARASDLYTAYTAWAEQSGQRIPLTQQSFGRRLSERGYQPERRNTGRWWTGIGIRREDNGQEHDA